MPVGQALAGGPLQLDLVEPPHLGELVQHPQLPPQGLQLGLASVHRSHEADTPAGGDGLRQPGQLDRQPALLGLDLLPFRLRVTPLQRADGALENGQHVVGMQELVSNGLQDGRFRLRWRMALRFAQMRGPLVTCVRHW